jgi:2-dehydro-3-deoxyphosphogluconate aldolase/(4S)-4-hydroxy-2-oxoglutarate aldolase
VDRDRTLEQIKELGLLAVLRGPSPELTIQIVEALVAGGVTGIEITYTTPQAATVVRELARSYGAAILLGMGTVTEPAQAAEAVAAGAQFLVSPHCDEPLAQAMSASEVPIMIGALTPSEVMRAWKLGADIVKLFPGALAGPAYVRNLRGPFPHIPLMPTGGVTLNNIGEWFAAGVVAVGAGSDLCPSAWAADGRFDDITRRAEQYVAAVSSARSG